MIWPTTIFQTILKRNKYILSLLSLLINFKKFINYQVYKINILMISKFILNN